MISKFTNSNGTMKPINANATVQHFTETNAAGISKSNRI